MLIPSGLRQAAVAHLPEGAGPTQLTIRHKHIPRLTSKLNWLCCR
mgnify:CR=1 FL=1